MSVKELMRQYFALKDFDIEMGQKQHAFFETYKCENMRSDYSDEPPTECINRSEHGTLVDDACEPCKARFKLWKERKAGSIRRGVIMRQVKAKVRKDT